MAQQLYLLRHADAVSWDPLGSDFSRSLSTRGASHAQLLSGWASESLPLPNTILCSPAKRTRETLEPLLSRWPQLRVSTDYIDSMYCATLNQLLNLAEDAFSYSERLMMVGHNPGMMEVLNCVLQAQPNSGNRRMNPGTLAVITFPGNFKRDGQAGQLLNLIERENFSFN